MTSKSDSNGKMDGVGRTDATIHAYLTRGFQLWNRAALEYGIDPDHLHPGGYLDWLEKHLPTLKPASRRQYIASAKTFLNDLTESEDYYDNRQINIEAAIRRVNGMQSSDYPSVCKPRWRGKTSSQKAKKIDLSEMDALLDKAKYMRGKWIKPAFWWLYVNTLVGLRPTEWRYARLVKEAGVTNLVVKNAKNTNGRSHGEERHLDISALDSNAMFMLQVQIQEAGKHAKDDKCWDAYYNGARKALHAVTRKFMPYQRKYPSLYSSRHQFSADAKAAGLSKVVIAALMGHAVDSTAEAHYGKKKHGRSGFRVKANPSEVERIRVKSVETPDETHGFRR